MLDSGYIIKFFKIVLGSNRPSVMLAIPFMIFGFISNKITLCRKTVAIVSTFLIIGWIIEVYFIFSTLGKYNIFMTVIGGFACASIYLLLKDSNNLDADKDVVVSILVLFGVQYSINELVIGLFKIQSIYRMLVWTLIYYSFTFSLLSFYYIKRAKTVKKVI